MRDSTARKIISNVRFPIREQLTDGQYVGLCLAVACLIGLICWAVT